jgi:hypothetical protein
MNDLEERLRADLQQATAGVEDSIDAEDALLAGHRARSSRRMGATIGISALAAVAGLVGWTVLQVLPSHSGGPSPLETISAVPSTPATFPSTTATPSDPLSATFEIDGSINGVVPTYDSITIGVQPSGAEVAIKVTMEKEGKQPVERTFTTTAGSYWEVRLDKHLAIGIVPERVNLISVEQDTKKVVLSGDLPLEGIGATAYWLGFEQSGGPNAVRGLIWERDDGTIYDSLGNEVGSARVPLEGDEYMIYRDSALDTIGLMPTLQGGNYSFRLRDNGPAPLLDGGMGRQADDGTWTWTQFGALPPGSHDISLELASLDGSWATAVLSDGWVAVLAINHVKSEDGKIIRSISYTEANGKQVHYPK